jgi:transcriptional regulator with XRE-family HTH domain
LRNTQFGATIFGVPRRETRPARRQLAATLLSLREAAGLKQREVAERLGLSASQLSRAERGDASAGPRMIEGYGVLFGAVELLKDLWAADRAEESARRRRVSRRPKEPLVPVEVTPSGDCSVPGDLVEWIEAVNPSNDCHVTPEEEFVQGWRVRNAGSVPWTGRFLTRAAPPRGPEAPWSPTQVPIPDTAPGDSVLIEVPLRGAQVPGTIRVHFKQTDADGRMYFPDVPWGVSVTVVTLPAEAGR